MTDFIYDIECYPNFFSCAFQNADTKEQWVYEISSRMNLGIELMSFLNWMKSDSTNRMIGFNNIHYDYPVLHQIILQKGLITSEHIYSISNGIIHSEGNDHVIWNDHYIPQVDLFKIHHFDNKSRATSLKIIQFNMRLDTIEDLPFPPGTILLPEQMDHVRNYNIHDVKSTVEFYKYSLPKIQFREELSKTYGRNFMNHNDTKIGKDIVTMKLEEAGVQCFFQGRKPLQTFRSSINLSDAVFNWINFISPEFQRIKEWFQSQTIRETNGVFKDVVATVKGFDFVFGLGGIHGSIKNSIVKSDEDRVILDLDVSGYYPSLAIVNRLYPEHLTEKFVDVYASIKEQRKNYKKGTPINAALKLGGNGVYGDSNNIYSQFYDPLYTMTVTINGQLLLCMLAEHILQIDGVELIQVNTDGLTIRIERSKIPLMEMITEWWEQQTHLELERVEYQSMFIRDVNNYFATADGKTVKRKGCYAHEFDPYDPNISIGKLDWNQNHSALVVPKIAEQVLLGHPSNAAELLQDHKHLYDFCLRTKVPRSSRLLLEYENGMTVQLQNVTRYYISVDGGFLYKSMPPTQTMVKKGNNSDRKIGIDVGWKVTECNNIRHATVPIDYNYYREQINKITLPLKEI